MGNGREDGEMKNIWVQSPSSQTFSVLFNYFTLPLPLIVSRFSFLVPPSLFPIFVRRFAYYCGKLTQYTTVLPGKAPIRQVL